MARTSGKLTTFSGVFCQVVLSQFSTGIFLRTGFLLGHAGLLETLAMFAIAYGILLLTLLSICAISTNGAIETGGAYFMTSRVLGPEFGAAIGVLLFCSQIISCALSISGFVEFGMQQGILPTFPDIDIEWNTYCYQTIVLFGCLLVCLVGSSLFARTTLAIFLTVVVCFTSVIASFFLLSPFCVPITSANVYTESFKRIHKASPYSEPTTTPVPTTSTATSSASNFSSYNNDSSASVASNWYTQFPLALANFSTTTTPAPDVEDAGPCGNYTGLLLSTMTSNLWPEYTIDYTTGSMMTFVRVFSILFSSVTGIMNGANISGELRRPAVSIPKGTLLALGFSALCYLLLILMLAASCDRFLLLNDYTFLIALNFWRPFTLIGVLCCTLCAALSNMLGGSRILYAIAKDNVFPFLRLCTFTVCGPKPSPVSSSKRKSSSAFPRTQNIEQSILTVSNGTFGQSQGQLIMRSGSDSGVEQHQIAAQDVGQMAIQSVASTSASVSTTAYGFDSVQVDTVRSQDCACGKTCNLLCPRNANPLIAVFTVYILVQLTSLVGNLNVIAPLCTVAFLLAYASINLTCLTLDLTSAPNFRPTFSYFNWMTALLGLLATLTMCFFVDALYTLVAVLFLLFLVLLNYVRGIHSQFEAWGSVSQALLFHQVRKYLLKLNVRQHTKYWRPSILLLVANPRSSVRLIQFVNCLKKSGLYVLAHVIRKDGVREREQFEHVSALSAALQRVIDLLQVKAFAEVSICRQQSFNTESPNTEANAVVNSAVLESFANLILLSGIGGLKPNTVAVGFYDEFRPQELLETFTGGSSTAVVTPWAALRSFIDRVFRRHSSQEDRQSLTDSISIAAEAISLPVEAELALLAEHLPQLRRDNSDRLLNGPTYVALLAQIVAMRKHLFVCRQFDSASNQQSTNRYINVFLTNFFNPRQILAPREPFSLADEPTQSSGNLWCAHDVTCLFLLQMAFVLQTYGGRRSGKRIRVFYLALSKPDRQNITNPDHFRMNLMATDANSEFRRASGVPAIQSSFGRLVNSDGEESDSDAEAEGRYEELLDDMDAVGRELRAVLSGNEQRTEELAAVRSRIRSLLAELRIRADVRVIALRPADHFVQFAVPIVVGQTAVLAQQHAAYAEDSSASNVSYASLTTAYLNEANRLVRNHCNAASTCANFLYLPTPPTSSDEYETYLQQVDLLTAGLPCTALLHGAQHVVPDELKSSA